MIISNQNLNYDHIAIIDIQRRITESHLDCNHTIFSIPASNIYQIKTDRKLLMHQLIVKKYISMLTKKIKKIELNRVD